MYIRRGLRQFKYTCPELREVAEHYSKKTKMPKFLIELDNMVSAIVFGTIYTEYESLDFYHRKWKNRSTFVTVGWLLDTLLKYNPENKRKYFRDKRLFEEKFAQFVKRENLNLESASDVQISDFFKGKKRAVLKKSGGCSGKQVLCVNVDDDKIGELIKMIRTEGYDLAEQYMTNCPEIAKLNSTSLNTIRVVTIHSDNVFNVVCACLRIGAVGSDVDNVSCGGSSASIDISTGRLSSLFVCDEYRAIETSQRGRDEIGFEIPFWNETLKMLREASKVVPDIHIVGWDVAITENGPLLIEGNESFHTNIMQYYASPTEPGVKARFVDCIKQIDEDMKNNKLSGGAKIE